VPAYNITSCVDFCAYHSTGDTMANPLVYGAIMDTFTGPCAACDATLSGFQGLTYDSSHEMAESVSDTDIGFDSAALYGYPGAWADNTNSCGEIADICDDSVGASVTTANGSYQVNELWSNLLGQCVSAGAHPAFQFSPPAAVTLGTPVAFTLTALNPSSGQGTDIAFAGTVHFTSNDAQATLPADYTFTSADQGTKSFQATFQTGNSPTITATDTINSAITATSTYTNKNAIQVMVGTSPAGLSFSVDGTSYSSAQTFAWTIGVSHTLATITPQPAGAGIQNTFASWSDGGSLSHTVTASANTTSYTANFGTSYQLTTAANPSSGGTVTPATGAFYAAGSVVNLVAAANPGYTFSSWTGQAASTSSASTTVTMNAPESVTANFAVNNVNVTVATSPNRLQVSADGATAQSAPLALVWQAGSQHTIATSSPQSPTPGIEYTFTGWSDGGAISHPVTAPATTAMYTASFNTSYQLTTGVIPAGSGTVSPASGGYYSPLAVVTLKATPNAGYVFSSWTGGVANAGEAATTVTIEGPQSVTANFAKVQPTSTTLKSSANPAKIGEAVTFSATVTVSGGAKPTGAVAFNSGTKLLKTVALSGDTASFSISTLAVGTYSITAVYRGDATARASTSAALKQVVEKAASATSMTSSMNPSHFGQAVRFKATVVTGGKPTGTVTFSSGSTTLGKATLTGGTAILSTSALAVGSHLITASYSGDATFEASASPELKQTVVKAPTTAKLASAKNPSESGQAVTFTATVTSTTGSPTGTVTFKRGTTMLGSAALSGGVAKLETSALPKGSDTITATYGGAADYGTSAASLIQMVQ